jgi:hypothetical protein
MAAKKVEWIIQLALPWMVSDPEEPAKEEKRRKKVARWVRPCALAIAEMHLVELGPMAKCRVWNARTGEYDALLFVGSNPNESERIKVIYGRDNRDKTP